MKKLLINGCSFGQVWVPDDKFSQEIGCDTVVNISRPGTGFQRTVRTTIEWVAQNGNPSMVIIPITFSHRWEMPIHDSEKFDNLDGIWMPLQTNSAMDNDISMSAMRADSIPIHAYIMRATMIACASNG